MFNSYLAPAANIPLDHGNHHIWLWPRPSKSPSPSLLHNDYTPSYDFITPLVTSITQLLDRRGGGHFEEPFLGTSALPSAGHILPRASDITATYTIADMGLGGAINTKAVLLHDQKVHIAILSVVAGTLSVITCLVALYWFVLMRRNFRRT